MKTRNLDKAGKVNTFLGLSYGLIGGGGCLENTGIVNREIHIEFLHPGNLLGHMWEGFYLVWVWYLKQLEIVQFCILWLICTGNLILK